MTNIVATLLLTLSTNWTSIGTFTTKDGLKSFDVQEGRLQTNEYVRLPLGEGHWFVNCNPKNTVWNEPTYSGPTKAGRAWDGTTNLFTQSELEAKGIVGLYEPEETNFLIRTFSGPVVAERKVEQQVISFTPITNYIWRGGKSGLVDDQRRPLAWRLK